MRYTNPRLLYLLILLTKGHFGDLVTFVTLCARSNTDS